MARIEASENVPIVSIVAPNGAENLSDSTLITWTAVDSDEDSLRFDVFTNRNGGYWETVATGVHDTFAVWHVDDFPGTSAGRIIVVATDGWHTVTDSSDGVFTIAAHNPAVYIESPQDTAKVLATSYVTLSGRATDLEDGYLPDDSLMWSSDIDGFLGTGGLIQADSLSVGLHLITLSALDQDSNYGFDYAHVQVLADIDQDGMDDVWEAAHGLDASRHDAYTDFDLDQLMNGQEYNLNTLPNNADTDEDGYSDGEEIAGGSDPLDYASIPTVVWLTSPTALSPLGSLGFNNPLIFTWTPSSADDSLRPVRYEVHLDTDPNFTNPLVVYADTLLTGTAPWQLSVGLEYSWKVKATDLYGHWMWSEVLSFTRESNPQVPMRVEDLTIMKTGSGLQLDWSPVTTDTTGNPIAVGMYVISASPALDGPYLPIAFTTDTSWTDTEVESLEWPSWFYVVEGNTNYNQPQVFSRRNWPVQIRSGRAVRD